MEVFYGYRGSDDYFGGIFGVSFIYVKVHDKVERKKAKKLAIRNSVLCCVLFFVFRAVVSGGAEVYFSVPVAFFYYFINKYNI